MDTTQQTATAKDPGPIASALDLADLLDDDGRIIGSPANESIKDDA